MRKFIVRIKETLVRDVEVEADSFEEAEVKVEAEWNEQKHVLDADDFVGAEFNARLINVEDVSKLPLVRKECENVSRI